MSRARPAGGETGGPPPLQHDRNRSGSPAGNPRGFHPAHRVPPSDLPLKRGGDRVWKRPSSGLVPRHVRPSCASVPSPETATCRGRGHPPVSGQVLILLSQYVLEGSHFLKRPPGSQGHAGERLVGDGNRQARDLPQDPVQLGKQRTAAGEHDPLVHDVGSQFRSGVLKGHLHGLDDRADRLGQTLGDLHLVDHELLGDAVHQVAAPGHPSSDRRRLPAAWRCRSPS